ncbi:DUF1653 domain-containing protein [Peptacetobacter hominis]|uniref:DUF1653 domain-containing protein n=1 Tax=Peptacetobacter hominis TaxID=2743610 RepID=A0A544QW76_9FIRM|nr:DUF1653 domain-containing protein [Peptacetobacter hominis]TQQ84936.1 DUF1653 domain-containing protein [Peptacetobacter hominis]
MRNIEIKRLYRHFKGNLYYVHDIAVHSETGEKMVVYQAMYGDYGMFVRPFDMFIEEVEEGRKDNITNQKYRFEIFEK